MLWLAVLVAVVVPFVCLMHALVFSPVLVARAVPMLASVAAVVAVVVVVVVVISHAAFAQHLPHSGQDQFM